MHVQREAIEAGTTFDVRSIPVPIEFSEAAAEPAAAAVAGSTDTETGVCEGSQGRLRKLSTAGLRTASDALRGAAAPAYRFFGLASRFNALAREVDLARDLLAATLGSNPGYLASLAPPLCNCGAPAAESPNSNHTRDRFARER